MRKALFPIMYHSIRHCYLQQALTKKVFAKKDMKHSVKAISTAWGLHRIYTGSITNKFENQFTTGKITNSISRQEDQENTVIKYIKRKII